MLSSASSSHAATADHELSIESRIRGCWLGKSIGGTLGLPAEGRMERLHFSFYDPVPTIAPPNDDLELQLVWLDLVEKAGSTLTQQDFARAWTDHLHYMWDEYGRTRWNLRRGVPTENVGTFENHFVSGMGSPIRSEIWACLFPGKPDSAAYYAALDASLDHGVEGIAGEVLFATMQSILLENPDIQSAIHQALRYIPAHCDTAKALQSVVKNYHDGVAEWECWEKLLAAYGNENFTHTPLNVGLTIWGLLYGEGDFEKSILLAVNGGYDTDCTAATVGATLGMIMGEAAIPEKWIAPIGEGVFIGPGILGIHAPTTLGELTKRTVALIGKLKEKVWDNLLWQTTLPIVELAKLPGTILLHPADGSAAVHWANGELPVEVKRAGGASWTWAVGAVGAREIICLARKGGAVHLDGHVLLECPAGLPYVPATHRSPEGSRAAIPANLAGVGEHSMQVILTSRDPDQQASVILAYPNLHICPWTAAELPHPANLPA